MIKEESPHHNWLPHSVYTQVKGGFLFTFLYLIIRRRSNYVLSSQGVWRVTFASNMASWLISVLGGSGVTAGSPLKPSDLSIPCGCVRYGAPEAAIATDLFCIMEQTCRDDAGNWHLGMCSLQRSGRDTKTWSNVNFLVSVASVVSEWVSGVSE